MSKPLEYLLSTSCVPGNCQMLGRAGVEQDSNIVMKLLHFVGEKDCQRSLAKQSPTFLGCVDQSIPDYEMFHTLSL